MRILRPFFIIILLLSFITSSEAQNFVVSILPTPVLNTPDFHSVFGGESGMEVKRDNQGLIRELEFIALPGTLFRIYEEYPQDGYSIYKITTNDYPYTSSDLFIDSRFVTSSHSGSEDRVKSVPKKEAILTSLNQMVGYQYMWGGNYAEGISEMLEFYSPVSDLNNDFLKRTWCLEGVDCSGLIYQATDGTTPRNTSSLVYFGEPVDIEAKTLEEIAEVVEPLDFIVWKGHLVIVYDENTVIESSNPEGVHKSNLLDRLYEVMETRTPVNNYDVEYEGRKFVIRRWIKD